MCPSTNRPKAPGRSAICLKEEKKLGGAVPSRINRATPLKKIPENIFSEYMSGSGGRAVATTTAFVKMLSALLKDKDIGRLIVPIVPDEARTFGMEPLFRQVGIYASEGQKYEPVDSDTLLYYREAKDGQILEEGITEGGWNVFIHRGGKRAYHARN